MRKILSALFITATIISCNENKTDANAAGKNDSTVAATDNSSTTAALTPQQQQEAWMSYMTPGNFHQMIAKDNGTWTADMTMWSAPDSPAVKTTGMVENSMILGGRYQQSKHTSSMWGMPFEGISTTGYDNAKKKFVSTWVDNMGTGIMTMEGTYDSTTRTMKLEGKCFDPATGKDCTMREEFTYVDDNTQKMQMFTTSGGVKEFKNMEMTFTRKKK
jgi:hypothetical protein